MDKMFYTTEEVASMLKISTHRVSYLREHGLLRGRRYSRQWLYTFEDIQTFLEMTAGKDLQSFTKMTKDAAQKKFLQ